MTKKTLIPMKQVAQLTGLSTYTLSDREITDVMVLMQYLAGMPAAYNGALATKEVLSAPKNTSPYR